MPEIPPALLLWLKPWTKLFVVLGGAGGGQGPICLNVSSKAVFQDLYIWCVLFSYMYIFY